MTGFILFATLAGLAGAVVAALLAPRWSVLRAALAVPALCAVVSVPTVLYLDSTDSWDAGQGTLGAIIVAALGASGAVASFVGGLLAGVLRLRYLRRQ